MSEPSYVLTRIMDMPRFAFTLRTLLIGTLIFAVLLGVGIALRREIYHFVTGWPYPVEHIEKLNNPRHVTGWTALGLTLKDGSLLPLPGRTKLPDASPILAAAISSGVEQTNGRVYGLIRIHHWCGNDPVREHIARVDLSLLLEFLQLGEPKNPNPEPLFPDTSRFGQFGWNISGSLQFCSWCKFREAEHQATLKNPCSN